LPNTKVASFAGRAPVLLWSTAASTTHSPAGSTTCFFEPSQPTVTKPGPVNRSPRLKVAAPLFGGGSEK
jgi:hypothetical protein